MEWFNVFGLIFVAVIMIPNIVFAPSHIMLSYKNAKSERENENE